MIRLLLASFVAALAVPASAAAPEGRIAALINANAAYMGAPVPQNFEFAPAASKASGVIAPKKASVAQNKGGRVSGTGWVSGSGWMSCSARNNNETGWMSGSVWLNGDIRVYGSDGSRGDARVSGNVWLSGSCRGGGGGGFASGWARLDGWAQMYDKDGKPIGSIRVDGNEHISQYVGGSFVHVSQYFTVSGWTN